MSWVIKVCISHPPTNKLLINTINFTSGNKSLANQYKIDEVLHPLSIGRNADKNIGHEGYRLCLEEHHNKVWSYQGHNIWQWYVPTLIEISTSRNSTSRSSTQATAWRITLRVWPSIVQWTGVSIKQNNMDWIKKRMEKHLIEVTGLKKEEKQLWLS